MFEALFKPLLWLLMVMLGACAADSSEEEMIVPEPEPSEPDSLFQNPILTSGPDPWVFQTEDKYYITFTTGINVTLYTSDKMSDLSDALKRVVWRPPTTGPNSKNIWAPEIHQIDGSWYVYYAADNGVNENHRMFVLQNDSEDPTIGQWTDQGELRLPDDRWAIDGTIFEHQNNLYYLWSGWEGISNIRQDIYICRMSDPLTSSGERVLIAKPEFAWETNGVTPTVTEGPQVLKRNGKLFIVYSAGACWTDGYSLGLLTADEDADLLDPASWEKSPGPVFVQNEAGGAFGPGHNGFFKTLDGKEDWIIYHANPFSGQGCGSNRSIRIQPFTWTDDGFPDFGDPYPLSGKLTKPSGEY